MTEETYEYAGFIYRVLKDGEGGVYLVPIEDQHRAAWKERHIRAARECYEQEKQNEGSNHKRKRPSAH